MGQELRLAFTYIYRGSMEPAFYRGDILFLWNPEDVPYVVGDITVYQM